MTAQRREEKLQDVAIAATALSGEQLDDKAVERIDDLQFATPALSITDQGLTQSVNIRGIGLSSGSPAVANGVATYYDNIFQPPNITTRLFYDVASVEVLRGHRIRVQVTSSCFPRWDRNLNTGDQLNPAMELAEQSIFHDAERPSFIELPVIDQTA